MFCPKCGNQNADTNRFCKKCGKQLPDRSHIRQAGPQGLVGQVLDGKYRIDAKLGSGGMGDVYQATRLLVGDSVAIKILHTHLARDPAAAERFRREAMMATRLRHKNVVGIYDVGIAASQNAPYILMELAEGYTLRQIINEYRVLPLEFAVTVTTQVCSALDEAHNLGIVHRDIKPENIVANETANGWSIKVLDFGIAKLYNQTDIGLTQDGSAMGTPQYMSPEQCLGEPLDARSDIYSVGILLYEMLCGTVPFKSATPSAIAIHQVQTPPQAPRLVNDEIHPAVEGVILKSIWKQREYRHQKASELAKDLIQAATTAFRSGLTAPPAPPIAAPDIEPEFAAADETGEAQAQVATDIDTVTVGHAVLEDATPQAEEVRDPVTVPDIEATAILPPSDELEAVPDLKAIVPIGKGRGGAKTRATRRPRAGSKPSVSDRAPELDPPSVPALADKGGVSALSADVSIVEQSEPAPLAETLELANLAKDATTKIDADENMADIFAEAELRLDEILVDHSQDTLIKVPIETEREQRADDHVMTEQLQPDPVAISTDDVVSLFGLAPEKRGRGKFAMLASFTAALLLVFGLAGVAAWTYYSTGGETGQTQTPATGQGDKTTELPAGMVLVPGGEFIMGSDTGDPDSRPAHKVSVKPFFMDVTEVTNEAYKKFVDETKHAPPPGWKKGMYPDGQAKFPVTGINWDDATAYAKWAGKRLPTEEEWEFAARGNDERIYPWGNDWKVGFANAGPTNGLREVGKGDGKSPFGMLDMVGNAWEWTSSDFTAYPGGKLTKQTDGMKVLRGGCYLSKKDYSTVTYRFPWALRDAKDYGETGFRCAKDSLSQ